MRKLQRILVAPICFGLLVSVADVGRAVAAVAENETSAAVAEVRLASGQILTAFVDAQTDESRLWLRFEGRTAALYRPVAWRQVDAIVYDGSSYSVAEFQELVPKVSSQRSIHPAAPIERGEVEAISAEQYDGSLSFADVAEIGLAEQPRATSIVVDAFVANWDADVEVDGLVLGVTVMDQFGNAIPVRGALSVELIANRRAHRLPQLPSRRQVFDRLARWNRPFQSLGGMQVFFRLPFQAVHPDFDATAPDFSLVHAKLAVPGSGVLEASVADVRVRPYSRIRNQIETGSGSRFIPTEGTGRARGYLAR